MERMSLTVRHFKLCHKPCVIDVIHSTEAEDSSLLINEKKLIRILYGAWFDGGINHL